jgi:hypothetical protein
MPTHSLFPSLWVVKCVFDHALTRTILKEFAICDVARAAEFRLRIAVVFAEYLSQEGAFRSHLQDEPYWLLLVDHPTDQSLSVDWNIFSLNLDILSLNSLTLYFRRKCHLLLSCKLIENRQ